MPERQTFVDRKHVEVDAFAATVVATDPESDYWFWDYLVGDSATDGAALVRPVSWSIRWTRKMPT